MTIGIGIAPGSVSPVYGATSNADVHTQQYELPIFDVITGDNDTTPSVNNQYTKTPQYGANKPKTAEKELIPGVPNFVLYAGGAGLLAMVMMKGGR